jgi:hypothetical protein
MNGRYTGRSPLPDSIIVTSRPVSRPLALALSALLLASCGNKGELVKPTPPTPAAPTTPADASQPASR